MSFALIGSDGDGKPVRLLGTHRTLRAAQENWKKRNNRFGTADPNRTFPKMYPMMGILTPDGLVNFYGNVIPESALFGKVECIMKIVYPEAEAQS